MKVFVPENWVELKEKLSEIGRVVEIRKGDCEEECCALLGKSLRMVQDRRT